MPARHRSRRQPAPQQPLSPAPSRATRLAALMVGAATLGAVSSNTAAARALQPAEAVAFSPAPSELAPFELVPFVQGHEQDELRLKLVGRRVRPGGRSIAFLEVRHSGVSVEDTPPTTVLAREGRRVQVTIDGGESIGPITATLRAKRVGTHTVVVEHLELDKTHTLH